MAAFSQRLNDSQNTTNIPRAIGDSASAKSGRILTELAHSIAERCELRRARNRDNSMSLCYIGVSDRSSFAAFKVL
jgi:hypothetical protein